MINDIFKKYDVDNSGNLDKNETWLFVKNTLGSRGFRPSLFETLFREFDKDGSGCVDKDEMVALVRKLMWNQDVTPPASIIIDTEQSDGEMSARTKTILEAMQEEIEEVEDPEEKAMKEELLLRFRNQIEFPYWSDNIYMELNIENLK